MAIPGDVSSELVDLPCTTSAISDECLTTKNADLCQLVSTELRRIEREKTRTESTRSSNEICRKNKYCDSLLSNKSALFVSSFSLLKNIRQCLRDYGSALNPLASCTEKRPFPQNESLCLPLNKTMQTDCFQGSKTLAHSSCYSGITALAARLAKFSPRDFTTASQEGQATSDKLDKLGKSITAHQIALSDVQLHYAQVQEGCELIVCKNCPRKSNLDLNLTLQSSRNLLAALESTLLLVPMLHTLHKLELFHINRTFVLQQLKIFSSLDAITVGQMLGRRSSILARQICHDLYPCQADNVLCSDDITCQAAHSMLFDLQPYTSAATYQKLSTNLSTQCTIVQGQNRVMQENFRGQANASRGSNCSPYCPPVPECPFPYFIKTDHPDLVGISFSPQRDIAKYSIAVLKQEGLQGNTDFSQHWCAISCRPEIYWGSFSAYIFLRTITMILVFTTMLLAIFGMVLAANNRFKMLENPRRSFLYLNLASFCGQASLLGVFFPKESVWCNSDGSLAIMKKEDASVVCLFCTAMREVYVVAAPLAFVWLCYIWRNTIRKLANIRSVTPVSDFKERIFVVFFFILPWIWAISQLALGSQLVEGQPMTGSCTFLIRSGFTSSREFNILHLIISFLISSVIFLRTSRLLRRLQKESDRYRPQPALERWRKRHRFIAILCVLFFIFGVIQVANGLLICFNGNASPGMRSYPEKMFDRFKQCVMTKSCKSPTRCTLPTRFSLCHIVFYIEVVLVQSLQFVVGFCWMFFGEVKWPGRLQLVKQRIVNIGCRRGH